MTQGDIYTKFMIEYDKANITSSYPSLTKYEIATILDKAYLALIAQKVTGNNPRKVPFEYDTKAIEDIRLLEYTETIISESIKKGNTNEFSYKIPKDFLYYIDSVITSYGSTSSLDDLPHKTQTTIFLNHELAKKFKVTDTNMPWIKQPIVYTEAEWFKVLVDPYKFKNQAVPTLTITYIKQPVKFVENTNKAENVEFELSDTVAEELINLAILFATESVESPRLQTKSSLLSLES